MIMLVLRSASILFGILVARGIASGDTILKGSRPGAKFPDFLQYQDDLPGKGIAFCAPAAASNGLAWLAGRGYPRLMPQDQLSLVRKLGSGEYMRTDIWNGTDPDSVMKGLVRYVKDCGYGFRAFDYRGWRRVSPAFRSLPSFPRKDWLSSSLKGDGVVLLNLGWYRKEGKEYHRVSGHWVTLVAIEGADILVANPSRPKDTLERIRTREIESGRLTGSMTGLPRDATGALECGGRLPLPRGNGVNAAILDCAVMFSLKR